MRPILHCAMAVLLVATGGVVLGDVLTSDTFSYTGALTANGWAAHSGAGNKVIMADGSVATLDQSGGSGEDVNKSFFPRGATDKIYAGFDVNVAAIWRPARSRR